MSINQTHAGGNVDETFWSSLDSQVIGYVTYGATGTVMIQWTAKMYYGNEWGC